MKKSLLLIAIMLLMFFINKAVVNASMDVTLCGWATDDSGNTCISNNSHSIGVWPSTDSSSFNYTISGSTSNPDDGLKKGQRWRITADFCTRDVDSSLVFDYRSSVGVTVNDSLIFTQLDGTCSFTKSDGTVFIGRPLRLVNDFTITTNGVFYLRYFYNRYYNNAIASAPTYFMTYSIEDEQSISINDIGDKIITNDNFNTQSVIDNQNQNTDRIVNAQNGTTNAVNGLNNSVNNTDTSGSENFLTSIINDPAFQDNTGINGIIQLPLAMISSLSNQCSPIDLHIPFLNVDTQLPCISSLINSKMPSVANILRIAVNGFVLYRIFVDIVGLIKSARNPDEDRLDVLEL